MFYSLPIENMSLCRPPDIFNIMLSPSFKGVDRLNIDAQDAQLSVTSLGLMSEKRTKRDELERLHRHNNLFYSFICSLLPSNDFM